MKWGFKSIRRIVVVLGLAVLAIYYVNRPFAGEGRAIQADVTELEQTSLSAHLEAPIIPGRNLLWCATFQLAWNELCTLAGEDLHFRDREPEMVAVLNKKSTTRNDIDAESYVAIADFVRNDVFGQIERQVEARFHGQFVPRYVPPKTLTPRPQDVVAYACLCKNLEFETPFERIDQPLVFRGTPVPCFGVDEEYKSSQAKILEQILILDYQTEDDFVIELVTKSKGDRLILAKVTPGETLAETIEAIGRRIAASEPIQAGACDVLNVPKCDFDLTRHFTELEGLNLTVQNATFADDLTILSALQNVRFEMNEKGVRLRSESHMSIGCGGPMTPESPHIMIFDKPFLVVLQRRDREMPYFAMWVDNAELLVQ